MIDLENNTIYNSTTKILGIKISTLKKEDILEKVAKKINKLSNQQIIKSTNKPFIIFTPNSEIAVYAQNHPEFKDILNSADINIPDGFGIIWASRFLGGPLKQRITGIDLMKKLVKMAAEKKWNIWLIGGRRGVAKKALEELKKKYPGLSGWAEEGPEIKNQKSKIKMQKYNAKIKNFDNYDFTGLVNKITATDTKVVFVGMGAPKQEYFIYKVKSQKSKVKSNQPLILMAVGGAFDYLAGRVPRAPEVIRSIGFEWVWRLIIEPWRIKRQIKLLEFIKLIISEKLALKGNALQS